MIPKKHNEQRQKGWVWFVRYTCGDKLMTFTVATIVDESKKNSKIRAGICARKSFRERKPESWPSEEEFSLNLSDNPFPKLSTFKAGKTIFKTESFTWDKGLIPMKKIWNVKYGRKFSSVLIAPCRYCNRTDTLRMVPYSRAMRGEHFHPRKVMCSICGCAVDNTNAYSDGLAIEDWNKASKFGN